MEDYDMRQTIRDFKVIMADKGERKEFIGGLACVIAMIVVMYIAIMIFH